MEFIISKYDNEILCSDGSTRELYQTFKEELVTTVHNIFQKIKVERRTFPTYFIKLLLS